MVIKLENGVFMPEIKPKVITHEMLMSEYDYITLIKAIGKLYDAGKITEEECRCIVPKIHEKFPPIYDDLLGDPMAEIDMFRNKKK